MARHGHVHGQQNNDPAVSMVTWLTGLLQGVGPPQDIILQAVRSSSRSCANAWTHRYVERPLLYSCAILIILSAGTQSKEEQHQLPLVEDVPEDRRSPQARLEALAYDATVHSRYPTVLPSTKPRAWAAFINMSFFRRPGFSCETM